jgi:hypothetical protein
MFGRQTRTVHICVRGLNLGQIPTYLHGIGWPGAEDASAALLPIARSAERLMLDIDAGETVGPKIGLECGFTSHSTSSLAELANVLVKADLCVPEKFDSLIHWMGRVFELEDGPKPPAQVAAALYLGGLVADAAFAARVNHVKINFEHGRRLDAKAYLSLERRWRVHSRNQNLSGGYDDRVRQEIQQHRCESLVRPGFQVPLDCES